MHNNVKSFTNRRNFEHLSKSLLSNSSESNNPGFTNSHHNSTSGLDLGQLNGVASPLLPRMPRGMAATDAQNKYAGVYHPNKEMAMSGMPPISHVFMMDNGQDNVSIESGGHGQQLHVGNRNISPRKERDAYPYARPLLSGPHLMKGTPRKSETLSADMQPSHFENEHLLFDLREESMDDHLMKGAKITKYKPDCFCPRCEILRKDWRARRQRFLHHGSIGSGTI